jgi:hypothetical protein
LRAAARIVRIRGETLNRLKVVEIGRVCLTNNAAERALRSFALKKGMVVRRRQSDHRRALNTTSRRLQALVYDPMLLSRCPSPLGSGSV